MGSFDPQFQPGKRRQGDYRVGGDFGLDAFGFNNSANLNAEALKFGVNPTDYLTQQARIREGVLLSPEDASNLLQNNRVAGFEPMGEVLDGSRSGDDSTFDSNFTDPNKLPSDWQSAIQDSPLWDLTKYGARPNYALGKMASDFGPDGGSDPIAQGLINALVLPGLRNDISVGDMTPGLGGVGRDQLYDWFTYNFLPYMQSDDLYNRGSQDILGDGITPAGKLAPELVEQIRDFGLGKFDDMPLTLTPDLTTDILNNLNLSIGADDIDFDAAGVGSDLLSRIGIMPVGMSEGGGPGFSLAPGVGRDLAEALNVKIGEDFTISPETANIITGALQSIIPKSEDLFSEIIDNTPGADILEPLTDKITDVGGQLDFLGDQAGGIDFDANFLNNLRGEDNVGNTLDSILNQMGKIGEFTLPSGISDTASMVSSLYRNLFGGDGRGGIQNFTPGKGLTSLLPGGEIGGAVSNVDELLNEIEGFNTTGLSQGLRGLDRQSEGLLDKLGKAKGSFTDPDGINQLMGSGQILADALKNTLTSASNIDIDLPDLGQLPAQIDQLSTDLPGVEQQLRSLIATGRADENIISAIGNLMSGNMPSAAEISSIVGAVQEGLQLPDEVMCRLQRSIGEMATRTDGISTALGAAEGRIGDIEPPTLEQVDADQIMGALDMPDADKIMGTFPGLTDAMTQLQDRISNLQPSIDTGVIDMEVRDIAERISNLQPNMDTGVIENQIRELGTKIGDMGGQVSGLQPTFDDAMKGFDTAITGATDRVAGITPPSTDQLLTLMAGNMDLTPDQFLAAFPGIGDALSGLTGQITGPDGLGASLTGLTDRVDALEPGINLDLDSRFDQFGQDFARDFARGVGGGDYWNQQDSSFGEFGKLNQAFRDLLGQDRALNPFPDLNDLFQDGTPLSELIGRTGSLADFLTPLMEGDGGNFWKNLKAQLDGGLDAGDLAELERRLGKLIAEGGGGGGVSTGGGHCF